MSYLSQTPTNWRSPRARLADLTPAVLRLPDGRSSRGQLETISLTGGLLALPDMLDRGSHIKLMFLTKTGPVLGSAEMLSPVSTTRQPFRFVALEEGDQRRLRTVVQSVLDPGELAWIEKYRAALANQKPPRRGVFRTVVGALTLVALSLGCALYWLNVHPLK